MSGWKKRELGVGKSGLSVLEKMGQGKRAVIVAAVVELGAFEGDITFSESPDCSERSEGF